MRCTTWSAVAVAVLVPTGCTSGGLTGGGGEGPVTISFMAEGGAEDVQAYRDIAAAFEESQDDVSVELRFAGDGEELIQQLSTSIAGGSPPDVFLMNYRDYGQFAARDVIEPIGDRLASSSVLQEDDFYPEAMAPFRFDGANQTCIPQNASSLVVYYNADAFEEAGLDEPAAGWTWEQMTQDAVRLTEDEDDDGANEVHGLGVDPQLIRIAPFIWSNGGEVVDDDQDPTRLTLDGRLSTLAMQRFFDLRSLGLTPTDEEAEAVGFEERFLGGELGMFMDSRKVVPTLRTITDFDWDVAPLPELKDPAGILHSDAYCMTDGSEQKDAAWAFMEFALGPEGQRIAAATGRTVPSNIEVAESEAFLDPSAEPSNGRVYLDQIPLLRSVPNIGPWAEIEEVTNGLIEEGYYSNAEAIEVAREAVTQTAPLFARVEG